LAGLRRGDAELLSRRHRHVRAALVCCSTGIGPFKFVEFKPNESIKVARNRTRLDLRALLLSSFTRTPGRVISIHA
jgi:hypothetical protein